MSSLYCSFFFFFFFKQKTAYEMRISDWSSDVCSSDLLIDEGVTGFLVPPRAVDGYSRAIERIVGDPALRRQMGAAGTACAAGYQWETANQAVLDAYLDVMARRTG